MKTNLHLTSVTFYLSTMTRQVIMENKWYEGKLSLDKCHFTCQP